MEPSSYSGAGGKIRRRPFSRASASTTPYDRPPAAAAAQRLAAAAAAAGSSAGYQGAPGGGWVSRLVDPASRLIAGGAARLFSTVFRKRLAPAPAPAPAALEAPASAPPGRDADPKQDLPQSTHIGLTPAGATAKGKDPVGTSGDKALSEVEHLLMRKTFTRVEFDRLTDLLRARTVEPDLSAQVEHHVDKTETRTQIDGTGGSTSHEMAVDHSPPTDVPIRGVTSPADLAKQYMSSRYLKEPQPSSSRSQLFPGNKAEAGNTGYYRTSGAPLVQELKEFNNENPGLPVNGYMASGLRGRSAICRMSRSPYFKGPSSYGDMNASPFSSSHARTPSLAADGRQVLKRRGADFENELGSMGPIRRIRQKSNMMSHFRDAKASPRGNFPPSRTIGSNFAEGSSPLQESPSSKRLLLESGQSLRTVEKQRHSEDGKSSSDNVPPVPSQPNKMAEKIFEQLNIIAPSPKDKQSGQRSVAGSPSKSMSKLPVWQDNGPKGVSDPSSSRQFQDLDGDRPSDSDLNGSTLNKDKLKKDGSSKVPSNTFQDSGNKEIKSDYVATFSKPAILGNSVSATTSRKPGKPGFKMAVFEDLYEFDDDQEAPVQSKNLIIETEVKTTEQKRKVQHNKFEQKVESTFSKENAISSSVSEQPRTSTSKDVSSSGLFSSSDPEKKATPHVPANNNIGFTFPHVPPGGNTEATGSAVPLASNKDDKQTSASPFMFGAKPSSTSDLETSTTAGVKTEGRLGESVTKPTSLDSTNLERSNGMERAGDIHKSPVKVLPTAPPTSTPPLHFASAASTPSLSNGLSHASPPKLSNVTPTDKPAVSSAPSTNIASFAVSSSSPPISSPVPAFPTFKFGSSTSAVAAAKSESTSTETKPASTSFFGTVGTSTVAPEPASKTSSNLNSAFNFSSNITTFSSSPLTSSSTFSSTATFSSSPVASSGVGIASTNSAPSTTLATAPGVQSASAPAFAFLSSGNSIFGFSSPAQSTGLSTTVGGSTSQASAASTIFGSKLPEPQGAMSQSSATQFSSTFPTVATGAAASSSAPGTLLFGAKASSSGPGTVSFGAVGASSSGPGSVSVGVGASSSSPCLFSFGAGVQSSGPGTVSFGAAPSSSGPGTVSFGVTTSSSGPVFGNSPFGSGAAFSAASSSAAFSGSGSGFAFSAASSSAAFSGSGSGFAFSAASSSAASSLTAASTSMFSSSSTASSSAAFSNPFGSTPSPPSMFTFGQPAASSGGAFSFGAQSAPAFSSPSPQVYSFTSASMNSTTPQPAFGTTNANMGFGMGSPGNDQMNMEDSMADDTNQAAPPQASAPLFGSSLFGQPGSSPAAPVFGPPASSPAAPVFGAPAAQQPAGVFQFGGQQGSVQQNPAFAPAGGSLEFQGGNFSLGSTGGGDKSGRRIIKPKRTQRKK
ncbi:hypothetical protein ACQ4PT_004696 [Festuca glaucescens]